MSLSETNIGDDEKSLEKSKSRVSEMLYKFNNKVKNSMKSKIFAKIHESQDFIISIWSDSYNKVLVGDMSSYEKPFFF